VGVVICLERGVGLHMAQQIPLPLTVSCFSKIQIGFLEPAHLGSPRQRAVKRVCVCVCVLSQLKDPILPTGLASSTGYVSNVTIKLRFKLHSE